MANKDGSILRKNRIIGHRRKKNLCIKCGKELNHTDECIENYDASDNRIKKIDGPIEGKDFVTLTSKSAMEDLVNIMSEQISKEIEEKEIRKLEESTSVPQKIILQRDYIILNLDHSKQGHIIELSGIQKICQRYKDLIVCIFGNIDSHFCVSDIMKIKKITNAHEVKYYDRKTKLGYLHGCKCYFSYPNEFTSYCKDNSIPHFEFDENENFTKMKKLP